MKIETTLEQMLEGYSDWQEAIEVAHRDERAALGDNVSDESFAWNDVQEVLGSCEGEGDGDSWIAALLLKDGRYAFLSAWCDYTGWG